MLMFTPAICCLTISNLPRFMDLTPILRLPDAKNQFIWKDPYAGKDWGQEEKCMTEDEMIGWHHQLNMMHREACHAAVHGIAKSQTWLSEWTGLTDGSNILGSYAILFFTASDSPPSPVTSTAGYGFCFGSVSSLFLELFLHWSPVAYCAPTDLGSSCFRNLGFSWQPSSKVRSSGCTLLEQPWRDTPSPR